MNDKSQYVKLDIRNLNTIERVQLLGDIIIIIKKYQDKPVYVSME